MGLTEVGKRRPRIDARDQVMGRVQYTNDLYLPGMLYAKPLLSTEHHARIVELDTSAAERLPGVKTVATAKDAPDNVNGLIIPDQPVYAEDKVRYRGEIVALVAAESEEIAQEAVELIKVKYEPLPAVFDPREALEADAPIIHEQGQGRWCRGNQVLPHGHETFLLVHGDVEEGFRQSDLIVEHTFGTSAQRCAPIEPHAFIAKPEDTDRITIIGNSQMPFWHQPAIAKALRLPLNRVRMITAPIGGAFGQKNNITVEPNLAILAMKAGRPVKWALTTHEDFCYSVHQDPRLQHLQGGPQVRWDSGRSRPQAHREHRRLCLDDHDHHGQVHLHRCRPLSGAPSARGDLGGLYEQVPERGLPRLRHVATDVRHRADDGHHRREVGHGSPGIPPEERDEGRRPGRYRSDYARGGHRGLSEEGGRDERLGGTARGRGSWSPMSGSPASSATELGPRALVKGARAERYRRSGDEG